MYIRCMLGLLLFYWRPRLENGFFHVNKVTGFVGLSLEILDEFNQMWVNLDGLVNKWMNEVMNELVS